MTDLTTIADVYDSHSGTFSHSNFVFLDDQDRVWMGQSGKTRHALDTRDVSMALQPIPDDGVYAPAAHTITTASTETLGDAWIKRPKLALLDDEDVSHLCAQMLLQEVKTLEVLKNWPHPALVRYLGCIVRRNFITGIVLSRCRTTLKAQYESSQGVKDVDVFMSGIEAGVSHLHSLQYAHNDINPSNIGIDEHGGPVLLDMGSCAIFGEPLVSAGTAGWGDWWHSGPENDLKAVEQLRAWLARGGDSQIL
jgi:serine/threonine protein kinase